MVPRSLADKLFGEDISAVGKTLRAEENIWTKSAKLFTIGAVYKDFPENTQLRNVVYTAIDPDYNINNFSSSNWVCYLLLDNPAWQMRLPIISTVILISRRFTMRENRSGSSR